MVPRRDLGVAQLSGSFTQAIPPLTWSGGGVEGPVIGAAWAEPWVSAAPAAAVAAEAAPTAAMN